MYQFLKLVPVLIVASSLAIIDPALAGLVNEKISDISDNELMSYCGQKMSAGTSSVTFVRGDRTVGCKIRVQEANNSRVGGSGRLNGSGSGSFNGKVFGGSGNASGNVSVNGRNATRSVITHRTRSYGLTNYCREMVDRGFSNPFTGEGRVFVGDGGWSCMKTVNR